MQHPHPKYYFVRSRPDNQRHHQGNTNITSPSSNGGRNRVSFLQLTPALRVDHGCPHDMAPPSPPSSRRRHHHHHHTSSLSSRRHRDHGDQRNHHYRPAFTTAAKELRDALEVAQTLCAKLLEAHKRDTKQLTQFAGQRVLDVVWCARVGEVGEGGGVDSEGDKKGESERQQLGGVLEKVETALTGVAKAKIRVVGEGGGGDVEEKRLMEKVKGTREIFPGLVDVTLREVGGMRDLAVEMELLEAMLKIVLKK